jgi:hypothetical protein
MVPDRAYVCARSAAPGTVRRNILSRLPHVPWRRYIVGASSAAGFSCPVSGGVAGAGASALLPTNMPRSNGRGRSTWYGIGPRPGAWFTKFSRCQTISSYALARIHMLRILILCKNEISLAAAEALKRARRKQLLILSVPQTDAASSCVILFGASAKAKVCGTSNQCDIQINHRRMQQFVLVDLCYHSGSASLPCRTSPRWKVVLTDSLPTNATLSYETRTLRLPQAIVTRSLPWPCGPDVSKARVAVRLANITELPPH